MVRSLRGSARTGTLGNRAQGGTDRKFDVFITTVRDKYTESGEPRQSLDKTPPTERRGEIGGDFHFTQNIKQ